MSTQATANLYFDPDSHPKDTLKQFREFCRLFKLRYEAQFPDPPKMSMEAAVERWRVANTTETVTNPTPTLEQYDEISANWKSKDCVRKVIGMFSSPRFSSDWEAAEPNEQTRAGSSWLDFKKKMEDYYKPTENPTLMNYQFRELSQNQNETFSAFCNRVESEARMCHFKCTHDDCTAEKIAVRDQILIGTSNCTIRKEALMKSWQLQDLRQEGMKLESAARGNSEISGETEVNKLGAYSYQNIKQRTSNQGNPKNPPREINCFNCHENFKGPPFKHKEVCKARNSTCGKCSRTGHFTHCCRSRSDEPPVRYTNSDNIKPDDSNPIYNASIFRVTSLQNSSPVHKYTPNAESEFRVNVISNGSLASVVADTGAKVSVCGSHEAKQWNLLGKMISTSAKIKPYNSEPIPVAGIAKCAVSFGETSIPVDWYVVRGKCEPILSGEASVQLGIINFNNIPTFEPIRMVNKELPKPNQQKIQDILAKYPEVFSDKLGKHNNYQVTFHVDPSVKPVVTPPKPTPYHLKERVDKILKQMIEDDVIEEHPRDEPAPWVSRAQIVPKPGGGLRITLDARNVNKAIQSTNLPIPRQEDVKAKLSGSSVYAKIDFRTAFWQEEINPNSRYLTVFNMNDQLYRYKRLTMGIKSAQGELNTALRPLFAHIPKAHLIHDDLIIGAANMEEHNEILNEVLAAVSKAGLTLHPDKCQFGMHEIKFWGMINYQQPRCSARS